jgi:hypothetical protein
VKHGILGPLAEITVDQQWAAAELVKPVLRSLDAIRPKLAAVQWLAWKGWG